MGRLYATSLPIQNIYHIFASQIRHRPINLHEVSLSKRDLFRPAHCPMHGAFLLSMYTSLATFF